MSVIQNSNPVGGTIAVTAGSALRWVSPVVISSKTQYLGQSKINSISQLIKGISKLLQKLIKCLNDTTISVSFLPA